MAEAKTGLGKRDARHGGGDVHPKPHLLLPGIGGRQRRKGHPEALPGIEVGEHPGIGCRVGLHRMGQHIEARIGNEALGKLRQQVAVQNGRRGQQLFIHQRMLGPAMGQDGEIRDLRAGAGGGGNRRQRKAPLGKIGHGLGTVHGAAAAQGDEQIRLKSFQPCRPLRRQHHRRVRLHPVKDFHLFRLRQLRNPPGRAVFLKKGIRHHKDSFCAEAFQRRHRPGSGDDFRR